MVRGRPLDENWKTRQRGDHPQITRRMFTALVELRAAKEADGPFIFLPNVHKKTLNTLVEHDWAFASPGLDGTRYSITGRGLKALKVYEPVVKRGDDICPRCGVNPRRQRKTGSTAPYCPTCESRMSRRKYRLGMVSKDPSKPCSHCKKRPRFIASTGRVYAFCQRCKNRHSRQEHKRARRLLLERIQAGEFVPCSVPGCNEPRYVTAKSVQEKCKQHHIEYQREYNARKRVRPPGTGKPPGRPRKTAA